MFWKIRQVMWQWNMFRNCCWIQMRSLTCPARICESSAYSYVASKQPELLKVRANIEIKDVQIFLEKSMCWFSFRHCSIEKIVPEIVTSTDLNLFRFENCDIPHGQEPGTRHSTSPVLSQGWLRIKRFHIQTLVVVSPSFCGGDIYIYRRQASWRT